MTKSMPLSLYKNISQKLHLVHAVSGMTTTTGETKAYYPVKDLAVWLVTQSSSLHVTTNLLSERGSAIELTMSNWYSQKVLIHT